MVEYIDREKVIQLLNNFIKIIKEKEIKISDRQYIQGAVDAFAKAAHYLNAIPTEDVAPVVHGQIIWKERHRGGFQTAKCLHCFNDINTESNIPCKHIAKIDKRYTINEPYCSKCGKLLGDFLNYCPNCGAKMDVKDSEKDV